MAGTKEPNELSRGVLVMICIAVFVIAGLTIPIGRSMWRHFLGIDNLESRLKTLEDASLRR